LGDDSFSAIAFIDAAQKSIDLVVPIFVSQGRDIRLNSVNELGKIFPSKNAVKWRASPGVEAFEFRTSWLVGAPEPPDLPRNQISRLKRQMLLVVAVSDASKFVVRQPLFQPMVQPDGPGLYPFLFIEYKVGFLRKAEATVYPRKRAYHRN
jgi:hypothetical protein